jgi:hypothetical protein
MQSLMRRCCQQRLLTPLGRLRLISWGILGKTIVPVSRNLRQISLRDNSPPDHCSSAACWTFSHSSLLKLTLVTSTFTFSPSSFGYDWIASDYEHKP